MKWNKLGLVYNSDGKFGWNKLGAFVPTAMLMDGFIRIYVAMHDEHTIGRIGFVDVDCDDLTKVLYVSEKPIIDIGQPGTFDDNGMTPMSIVVDGNYIYLYYVGWELGVKVRYFLFAGLLISQDGGQSFERASRSPILGRKDWALYLHGSLGVLKEGKEWKTWCLASSNWIQVKDRQAPTYKMHYEISNDGIEWKDVCICMEHATEDEYGFGRPWVIKENGIYKMFYSVRHKSIGYRIGYAESEDGLKWERLDDQIGLNVSDTGWDSECTSFGSIVDYKDNRYIFYNGSHGGYTGFGVAVLEEA
jgi:hypothetical protein